ncbi:MAG: hypothetical protein PQJ61_11320 [Spirochaetales bacterium]|uniref:Tetratricopeptide repeat protein n=1 Tax=Candidatus Thalassospirochaeta sargassi TaxID=3119039 RepID=A0AAJ1ML05_9SPIO|nr:hypothetical protein [Spirochaetales bacterium]
MRNRVIFSIISVLILINIAASLQAEDDGVEVLLENAEKAFRKGNELLDINPEQAAESYRAAVVFYESVISGGTVNAALYYNTANCYLRLEKIGYAILNYRRALLYDPFDRQIRYNLDYARDLQKNDFESRAENEILRILFFWHYLIPFGWKTIVLISANLIFWTAFILQQIGLRLRNTLIIPLIILIAFGVSLGFDIRSSEIEYGVITADSTIGRLGDSLSYESAFDAPLYEGVEFKIKQRRVGWILAELPDGALVWFEEDDCGIVEE